MLVGGGGAGSLDIMGSMNLGVSDVYMAPVADRSLKHEKDLDQQLMHLSLVDICGAYNSKYKFTAKFNENGQVTQTNNAILEYIFSHKASYKLT